MGTERDTIKIKAKIFQVVLLWQEDALTGKCTPCERDLCMGNLNMNDQANLPQYIYIDINNICILLNLLYFSYIPLLDPLSPSNLPFLFIFSCTAISEMSDLDLATGDLTSDSVTEEYGDASVIDYRLYVVTFCLSVKLVKVGVCVYVLRSLFKTTGSEMKTKVKFCVWIILHK